MGDGGGGGRLGGLKAYMRPPIDCYGAVPLDQAAPMAWSVRSQRDESGTTGALLHLRQSRHDPQPARRLTLAGHHRLFILRPRRLTSMAGPAPTGRYTRCESGVHTQRHAERLGECDHRPLPSCHLMAPAP